METPSRIEQFSRTPKYVQIIDSIIESIKSGALKKGSKIPSINKICSENQLARETVVKAFYQLKQKGLIDSVHGKGFYVSSTNTNTVNRVFVLFDTFTSYKETLFYGIKEAFGDDTILDIYFHHFNYEVFKNAISSNIGNYTSYIVLPINHHKINKALDLIPAEKLYLLDIYPKHLNRKYVGIYQDFNEDVKDSLSSIAMQIRKYDSLKLVFRNTITDLPKELEDGFVEYCEHHKISHSVSYDKAPKDISIGESYIVIDDNDLVTIVESANRKNLNLGTDIGIISYNDTPLKKVVGNGISVISTDFKEMGRNIVRMIMNNERSAVRNKTSFVNRGSF